MKMIKVLILYNELFHYRIPVWNILAERCDLTVAYSEGRIPEGINIDFKVLYLPCKVLFKRIVIQKGNIRKLAKCYDVVVAYGDIAWLKYSTLPWFNNLKVVYHTLGVSASYSKGFDEYTKWDRIRAFFYSQADALAFYTQYPIEKYAALGIAREKMFEAPNTVEVIPAESTEKDSLLFIGTLYRQKGIQYILDIYLKLRGIVHLPMLNIIGDGPDFSTISEWVKCNDMGDIVRLKGAIYNSKEKALFFARAIACLSPKQAGLSVLESMGHGVPFITSKNAITGGEILNIHDRIDGVLLDDISQLEDVIKDISENSLKYIEMGRKAKDFYYSSRTIKDMANGLWEAILYAIKDNK